MELTNAKALVAKIKSDPETAKIFAGIKNAADFEAEIENTIKTAEPVMKALGY